MFNFKKISILPILAATCLNYAVANEKMQKFSVISSNSVRSGEKLHISLFGKLDSELSSVNCEITIDNKFFYLYKTQFTSDLFDIEIQKIDDSMKKIKLSLKKDVVLKVTDESAEIVSLDLNVKKKCPSGDSKIDFDIDYMFSNGERLNEKIEKNVSVNPKEKIVSVNLNGSNLPIGDNGNYKVTVPVDASEVQIDLFKTDGANITNEKITKNLNKTKDTKIKIADKEIVISKAKVQHSKKEKKNVKSKKKTKSQKSDSIKQSQVGIIAEKRNNENLIKSSNDEKIGEENIIGKIDNSSNSSKVDLDNNKINDGRKFRLIPSSCLLVLTMTICGVIMMKRKLSNNKSQNDNKQEKHEIK